MAYFLRIISRHKLKYGEILLTRGRKRNSVMCEDRLLVDVPAVVFKSTDD
jgi:hypothetical protein